MTELENIEKDMKAAAKTNAHPALELVVERVCLYARRRMLWLEYLWETNAPEANSSVFKLMDSLLQHQDNVEAEMQWGQENKAIINIKQKIQQLEAKLDTLTDTRFSLLIRLFELSPAESDLLQANLALALHPKLEQVFAVLNDNANRNYPHENAVARLFGHGEVLVLPTHSALHDWHLLEKEILPNGEPTRWSCPSFIRNWLLGINDLDPVLKEYAAFVAPQSIPKEWAFKEALDWMKNQVESNAVPFFRLIISGKNGMGKKTFAASLAAALNYPALQIKWKNVPETLQQDISIHAQRQALLGSTILLWELDKNTRIPIFSNPIFPIQILITPADQIPKTVSGIPDFHIKAPQLSIESQQALWLEMVKTAENWNEKELRQLLMQQTCHAGQIKQIANLDPSSPSQAVAYLNRMNRQSISGLVQLLETPFYWEDLVLPANLSQHLKDFLFEAEQRAMVWENPEIRRLFPLGRGLMTLFTGAPGTGKTMTAQVLAAQLQLDLYRIDLSSVISKYVGETSKNLDQILAKAKDLNAILFFDEADALFSRRTDVKEAQDRFANSDTNNLLQSIENYSGIAILASNKKANIDAGFTRRLRYVLDFPKPDTQLRLRLWLKFITAFAGKEQAEELSDTLEDLAKQVEFTGAQIKQTCLSALFASRAENSNIQRQHLLKGIQRELMKEGRGISRSLLNGVKR